MKRKNALVITLVVRNTIRISINYFDCLFAQFDYRFSGAEIFKILLGLSVKDVKGMKVFNGVLLSSFIWYYFLIVTFSPLSTSII